MGCDIHMLVQHKPHEHWYTIMEMRFPPGRDYLLFAIMAGVRGDESLAIALPRGIPDDARIDLNDEFDRYYLGDHSYSWLSFDELLEVQKRYAAEAKKHGQAWCESNTDLDAVIDFMRHYKNTRLIFGFDS
jgi:hypothetical protein